MSFINLFYSTQEMHKLLIQQSFNDYNSEINLFNKKYPNINFLSSEYCNLNKNSKKEWSDFKNKINNLEKILINNLMNYCKNYPHCNVSKNRFINEYKEFPYRLEQNISEVILEL